MVGTAVGVEVDSAVGFGVGVTTGLLVGFGVAVGFTAGFALLSDLLQSYPRHLYPAHLSVSQSA